MGSQTSYLRRRIDWFLTELASGRILIAESVPEQYRQQLTRELDAVRRTGGSWLDLNTCGPLLRSVARGFYGISKHVEDESRERRVIPEVTSQARRDLQTDYFDVIRDFFGETTGRTPDEFDGVDHFGSFIREHADEVADRAQSSFPSLANRMNGFYKSHVVDAYDHARSLGGLNLVVGGSRFTSATLDAVRSVLLYADSVFIPDPILPWIERERPEERFRHMLPLEAAYLLLQLDPLVSADLSTPALLVFPSWEKTLEADDDFTQDRLSTLFLRFMNHHVGAAFEDESEVYDYARVNEAAFLGAVESRRLFWPPGGEVGVSIPEALASYRAYIKLWWSVEAQKRVSSLSAGELVAGGIFDRLVPQHHVTENAATLGAHPLLAIDPQWHYFKLCAALSEGELLSAHRLERETIATLESLSGTEHRWLSQVPIDALVALRRDGANEDFRRQLRDCVAALHDANLGDIDAVSREVARGLNSMLTAHDREVARIEDDYKRRYRWTATTSWLALGAMMAPLLAPYLPLLGAADAALRYAQDKTDEIAERRRAARSLCGVLAATARRANGPA